MNIIILNWPRPPWEEDEGVVKGTGRDEPICVVIHIYMETTQAISLYSYLYLKLAKIPCFSYRLMFSHLQNHRTGGWNRFCLESGQGSCHGGGMREVVGKVVGG
jgi:hypothetical protein